MPIYEFFCENCKKHFDKLCSIKENLEEIECKFCLAKKVKKRMSTFAQGGNRTEINIGDSGSSSSCGSCSSSSCSTCSH